METLDISEKGGVRAGVRQTSDQRLFMQFLAFEGQSEDLVARLRNVDFGAVVYDDANDPNGIGLLTWSTDPNHFVTSVRSVVRGMKLRPEFTMLGRTYALGHEPNLEDWLLARSPRAVTDPEWLWHVWYPLRRKGEFNALPPEEQTAILREHGSIGHAFGTAGFAQDVRLACFGMDKRDNDFVIGLVGKELYPLSACVQAMRKTRQTSSLMQEMGPFFVGKAVFQRNG